MKLPQGSSILPGGVNRLEQSERIGSERKSRKRVIRNQARDSERERERKRERARERERER